MTRKLFVLLWMVICVHAAVAQVTTSGITGKVTAGSEEAIGATVKAVHLPSGTVYLALSNSSGRYTIDGMRPGGPYSVTISYIGHNSKQFDNVHLKLGERMSLSCKLDESEQLVEGITAIGRRGFASSKTGAAQNFSADNIHHTPTISASISDVIKHNPQLQVSPDGSMSFAGVNHRYNSFLIDGAPNNDVFGLSRSGFNGGQAGSQPLSLETLDQLQVSVAPFDVRQSGFTGGSINAVTKSGTNEFHGTVYGYGNNRGLISSKYVLPNGEESDPFEDQREYRAGFTLGGPILKDKLFFFANLEHNNKKYTNTFGIDGNNTLVDADGARQALDFISNLARQQGVSFNDDFSNPDVYTKSTKAGLKLDWNINDQHKASLRWQVVSSKQLNYTSNATGLVGSNYMFDFKSLTHTFTGELHSRLSNELSNELRLTYTRVRDERVPGNPEPMISVSGIGNGSVYLGNERTSMANSIDQDVWLLTDNLTWYKGDHTITLGTHNEFYRFSNLFIQDAYGSYYFNSLSDLQQGTISRYRYGVANTDVTGDPRWKAKFGGGQTGFYLQDRWNLSNHFELTFGLRMDIPMMFDSPTQNAAFDDYAAQQGWNVSTSHKLKSRPLWSPRVGFRWDVWGDRQLVMRGGAGIFTGRIPFVWIINNYSNTGIQLQSYDVRYPQNVQLLLNPNGQADNARQLTASSSQLINVFDDDFRFTQSAKLALGVDAHLLGIDWTFDAIYTKTLNDIDYQNLAVAPTGERLCDVSPALSWETRPLMQSVTAGTPFYAVYKLGNTSRGYSYSLSLKGEKHFDFGLDLSASYTYTRSKSVNSGLSSVAATIYSYNLTHGDPNSTALNNSAFNMPHTINVSAFYHINYGQTPQKEWTTTVGLLYRGNSGMPYTIGYYGDVNGDGVTNDLFYIPTDEQIDQMTFRASGAYTADVQRANLKAWLAADDYLSSHRGQYFEQFADNERFEHHFDLHLAQRYEFPVGRRRHAVELTVDIINIGNLLNKKWGRYTYSQGYGNFYGPMNATYSASTKQVSYQFLHTADYDMRQFDDYLSRWRGQIGLRYTF